MVYTHPFLEIDSTKQQALFHYSEEEINNLPLSVSKWFPKNNDAAIVGIDERLPLTYDALHAQMEQAPSLVNQRVALLISRQHPTILATALLSVMHQGGTACPLDPTLSDTELREALLQLGCTAAIATQDLELKLHSIGTLQQLYRILPSAEVAGKFDWLPIVEGESCEANSQDNGLETVRWGIPTEDRAFLLLRTSGTTAKPKVVAITGKRLIYNARATANSIALTSSDVGLNVMPLFHIGGITSSLLATLTSGASVVCAPSFNPAEFIRMLENEPQPTWYYGVPTIHKALLLYLQRPDAVPPRAKLRLIRSSGAHLPHADALALQKTFGCTVLSTYGMTECTPICSPPISWQLEVPDTVGTVISASICIADDLGTPLPYGKVGEILVKGPGVISGYEKTEFTPGNKNDDAFTDGWFRTGDLGTMLPSGLVLHKGRKREMLKRSGKQISLYEVDAAIQDCPGVDICVSFGVPNDFWGEEVACAIVLKSESKNITAEQIIQEARKRLDDYKVPRQILFVDYSDLPRTKSGKYKRHLMAEMLNVESVDFSVPLSLKSLAPDTIQSQRDYWILHEIREATSVDKKKSLILKYITNIINKMLRLGTEDIDCDRPLEMYGLDSLRRFELHNWIGEQLKIEIPITQIHGNISIQELSQLILLATADQNTEQFHQESIKPASYIDSKAPNPLRNDLPIQESLALKLRNLVYLSKDEELNFLQRFTKQSLRRISGIEAMDRLIYDYCFNRKPGETIHQSFMRRLKLKLEFNESGISHIPETGPVVIIANHPFGLIETAIVRYLVSQRRQDFKNFAATFGDINRFPERAQHMLPLDFRSVLTGDLTEKDVQSMNLAIKHVKQGGALIIFPAGFISLSSNPFGWGVEDRKWKPFAAKVITECQASVVPFYFSGQNSRLFNIISRLGGTSTMGFFFFREQLSKIGSSVNFQIGPRITYEQLKTFSDYESLTLHLRDATYKLKENIQS